MKLSISLIKDRKEIEYIIKSCADSFFNQSINSDKKIRELAEKYHESASFILALADGKTVGFAAFYSNDLITQVAYLSMIIVKESYQDKGIGQNILIDCINRCNQNGMKKLKLEVNCNNSKALNFYLKNEFKILEKNDESYYLQKSI